MPDDRYLEPEIETMSRSDLDALQEERILELVPYAYERSALVRKTWEEAGVKPSDINSMADYLERAPFVAKDDIRRFRDEFNDPLGGTLCVDYTDGTTFFSTSGTTGDATFYGHGWTDWHPFWAATARNLWDVGVRPGDRVLGSGFKMRGPLYHAEQMIGAVPLMVDTGIGAWADAMGAIREHRPVYATLTGLALVELEHLSRDYDMRELLSCFKGVGFAGEPLSAKMQQRLKDWGLDVFIWTSTGDVTPAWECREHSGCHAWEDTVLLESLDPAGSAPVANGEVGELVATALDNPVTPLIRFRSEDLIRATWEPCACGRNHARFWPVGRKGDETLVDGKSLVPMDVWSALEELPETSAGVFQLIRPQRELDELRVRVGYDPAVTGSMGDLEERVMEAISTATGIRPVVELIPEPELLARGRGGKLARVVKA